LRRTARRCRIEEREDWGDEAAVLVDDVEEAETERFERVGEKAVRRRRRGVEGEDEDDVDVEGKEKRGERWENILGMLREGGIWVELGIR
jgi:hypothetical protein